MIKVSLSAPVFDHREKNSAIKAINNLRLSQGINVKKFEKMFSTFVGTKYGVATNSGSSANLITLEALKEYFKLKKGDEVILPAATFATVPMPVLQVGLKPVFVDVDPGDLNISVKEIEKAITKRTKIVMIVHTLGYPARMREIQKICKKNKLILFEDCCEAHGASINKKIVGSFGEISAFSFFVAHNITTGEGGMVLTNNKKLDEILRSLREFGRIQMKSNKLSNRFYTKRKLKNYDKRYVFERPGYNLRMTDIVACFGVEQVKKLKYFNSLRNKNANYLINKIKINRLDEFLKYYETNNGEYHSYYTFPLKLKKPSTRLKLVKYLEKNGIETRPMMGGCLPDQPAFQKSKIKIIGNLKNSRDIRDNVFFIGVHPKLKKKHFDHVINCLKKFFFKDINSLFEKKTATSR